jgi:FixJ family two-component response regulator
VVLLDFFILNTSGPELIGQFGNDLKIIVTTESADKDAAVGALKPGAFDLLEKPFRNEFLHHSIWRALTVLENERTTKRPVDDLKQSRSEPLAR